MFDFYHIFPPLLILIMASLEELTVNTIVSGILPNSIVTIKHAEKHGGDTLEVIFVDAEGRPGTQLLFRDQEPQFEIVRRTRPLSFSAGGALFKLVSEAQRLRLGFLFDPMIAINTSSVEPLPHQITAVYETMLTRQPLRFLLADDPGAGKTIMTGLLIKELVIRGDVARCLIVSPGVLVEQWQDELDQKFNLPFDIMTNDAMQTSRTGNWFLEHNLCICRLDKLSRNEDIQARLAQVDWDLVVVDEAHKMSASHFGGEIKYTKRHQLGQRLSKSARQLLLLTATPHNGKEEDFQLFLSLIDGDRFEGRFRDGVHAQDVSDLMRRMVKENLVTMEGKPLFPERFAHTLSCELSSAEAGLYGKVTEYVRDQFNLADKLQNEKRRGTIGFALTILQRRLASSPEAIHKSLQRRRERLEQRLREEQRLRRGRDAALHLQDDDLDIEDLDDLDDAPETEQEQTEASLVDAATAAQTIAELEKEIILLRDLEKCAQALCRSDTDAKWQKLRETLADNPHMFDESGNRRKLVIFTEQRDTLNYLTRKLTTFLGNPDAVVAIHGQTPRENRCKIQETFTGDPAVSILVATDAAGEGINLQRAHLMVNYDLPWNPNRLEQRFGRIHRIGQRDQCHLWNLVAKDTREGEVFHRLLGKLEEQREALGSDAVFDVLGKVLQGQSLKELLIDAIRQNDTPEARARLERVIRHDLDTARLRELLDERQLTQDNLPLSRVQAIREEMERAQARRLQPHYIGAFFQEAFTRLGGQLAKREPRRYEIRNVPSDIRQRDRVTGLRAPVLRAYERVTFHKQAMRIDGKPPAALLAPGHPLLDATVDLVLERHRDLLRQGAVLIDPLDKSAAPRVLLYLEHTITDAKPENAGRGPTTVSRRLDFVYLDETGRATRAGHAPYLDCIPATPGQLESLKPLMDAPWLMDGLEKRATSYAIQHLVPEHLASVSTRREEHIRKTMEQVHQRLTREINYWDNQANKLRAAEEAGKYRGGINSTQARQRADRLSERLNIRTTELEAEKKLVTRPPAVLGGALIIPAGWFAQNQPAAESVVCEPAAPYGTGDHEVERLAMETVLAHERSLGNTPRDVSEHNLGYDIESRDAKTGSLRFIEVKGRIWSADTITVTANEIRTALNQPDQWCLAIVRIHPDGKPAAPNYVPRPFTQEPDFAEASRTLRINDLLNH
jgi:superfamily II DNA or RNA helicase